MNYVRIYTFPIKKKKKKKYYSNNNCTRKLSHDANPYSKLTETCHEKVIAVVIELATACSRIM